MRPTRRSIQTRCLSTGLLAGQASLNLLGSPRARPVSQIQPGQLVVLPGHFWGLGTPQVMLQSGSRLEAPGPLPSGGWSEDAQRQGCQRQAPPSEAGTRRLVACASRRGGKGTAKPLWVGRAGAEASRACPPPSEGASWGRAVGPWRQRGRSEQAAMRVRMWAGSQAWSGYAGQETGRMGPGVAPCCRGQDAGVGVEPRRGGGSAGSQRRRRGCSPAPSQPSPCHQAVCVPHSWCTPVTSSSRTRRWVSALSGADLAWRADPHGVSVFQKSSICYLSFPDSHSGRPPHRLSLPCPGRRSGTGPAHTAPPGAPAELPLGRYSES